MKLTRRKLAVTVLGSSAVSLAQTQPAVPATADDELKAARDRLRSNAEALASQKVPMAVEPAFQFKA